MEKMNFDLKLADECAKSFWGSTNLGCLISDKKGKVLKEYGYGCNNCKLCSTLNKEKENCTQAQLYGMIEAERFGGKYIYYCPMGLTCFVSPILGEVTSEAKITVGPFLMVERQDYIDCELNGFENIDKDHAEKALIELQKIPTVSTKRATQLSNILFMAVGFINNVWAANHLQNRQQSDAIQGQISDYIFHLKTENQEEYPIQKEKALLKCIAKSEKEEAHKLLNEILGFIMLSCGNNFMLMKQYLYDLLVLMGRASIDGGQTLKVFLGLHQIVKEPWRR